ncbi:MAG TPA: hypothetical protein VFQ16_02570 [Burkholderiaceae bacterium]|nr:hypothetical protein [Burkholderiaceae bacterium]
MMDMTPARTPEQLASLKQITLVVYALQALSFFFGVTAVIGVIVNYVKKEDAAGTLYESHFDWQIRTFWWGLAWSIVGFILVFALGLGLIVWLVAWIWAIYRVVKGWLKLNDNQPVLPA